MSAAERTATGRDVYLDNLRVVLITTVIVIHAVLGYDGPVRAWTYTELRETAMSPVTELVVFVVAAPFGFFLIGLLFPEAKALRVAAGGVALSYGVAHLLVSSVPGAARIS